MRNELVVGGIVYPTYGKEPLEPDFREKYKILFDELYKPSDGSYDLDVAICITLSDIRRILKMIKIGSINPLDQDIVEEPWKYFDGPYRFEKKSNEEILIHEEQDLSIILKRSKGVPPELLKQGSTDLYYFKPVGKRKYAIYRIKKK